MPELKLAICTAARHGNPGRIAFLRTNGAVTRIDEIASTSAVPHPSFAAWSPRHKTLYVASEIPNRAGRIAALSLGRQSLSEIGHAETEGNAAVHVSLDRHERHVFIANYMAERAADSAAVAVFSLLDDGRIGAMTGKATHHGSGPDRGRQDGPHCHFVAVSPDNRLLVAVDLGTDSLHLYRFDAESGAITTSTRVHLPSGCGPRHAVFHPSKPLIYVTGELDSTLMSVAVDTAAASGHFLSASPATARPHAGRNYPSGIAITPDGHHVLLANRGADTIVTFWTDPQTAIALPGSEIDCGGAFPRSIRLDQTGRFLAVANQSDNISIFGWDFASATLSPQPLLTHEITAPLDAAFVEPA